MRIDVVTLFPDLVLSVGHYGVTGRAIERNLLSLQVTNPRDYTEDVHRTVDDRPYGGGPGMVMKVGPLRSALTSVRQENAGAEVIYLSPQGRRFDQFTAAELATRSGIILLAGRYEGVDERVIEHDVDRELSLGDYVLSGGELGAMVIVDAIARLLPGALGDTESAQCDSFSDGLLEGPQYTRPEQVGDQSVPPVLLQGDHAAIDRWRRKVALGRTAERRPDLLAELTLDATDRVLLEEYFDECRLVGRQVLGEADSGEE
ncbi:MAG: tRNA (guanosine(37)-N1)-methyltransferase TrmD [Pseudomonadota bacterium]